MPYFFDPSIGDLLAGVGDHVLDPAPSNLTTLSAPAGPVYCLCGEELATPDELAQERCTLCALGALERENQRRARAAVGKLGPALVDDAFRAAHPVCIACGASTCDSGLVCGCSPAPIYRPDGKGPFCSVRCLLGKVATLAVPEKASDGEALSDVFKHPALKKDGAV